MPLYYFFCKLFSFFLFFLSLSERASHSIFLITQNPTVTRRMLSSLPPSSIVVRRLFKPKLPFPNPFILPFLNLTLVFYELNSRVVDLGFKNLRKTIFNPFFVCFFFMFLLLLVGFGMLVVLRVSQVDLSGCLGGIPCVVFFFTRC